MDLVHTCSVVSPKLLQNSGIARSQIANLVVLANERLKGWGDTTYAQILAKTTLPALQYEAHTAPLGVIFYTGNPNTTSGFPADFQNDAFATMRGSWNKSKPAGYKVIRVRFSNGTPVGTEDFVTGFLVNNNQAQFGRPVGIATLPDGSLLFSENNNGVIYRVSHKK